MRTELACWWMDHETQQYGIEMSPEERPEIVLGALLWQVEGLTVSDLTSNELQILLGGLHYQQMRSVVKADFDRLGSDITYHTNGTGRKGKQAWWLDRELLDPIADSVWSIKGYYAS